MTHPEYAAHAAFIAETEGKLDGMGQPFSAWGLSRIDDHGQPLRDASGFKVYMTQAEWRAKYLNPETTRQAKPARQELFA